MTENTNMKTKALNKDEVMILLDLISKFKVITTKATNATNNRLKEEAWKSVAQQFCASVGDLRRPEQLRLKWENLKKQARKRSALIRQNSLKTGGGKSYIPPDESLDRVAAILGTTCSGFSTDFGGDAEVEVPGLEDAAVMELVDFGPLPEEPSNPELGEGVFGGLGHSQTPDKIMPKKMLFNTPHNSLNKRRKLSEEAQKARRDKDLALATYFQAKAEKVKIEQEKLKLENDKLKLENEKLKLEIDILKNNVA